MVCLLGGVWVICCGWVVGFLESLGWPWVLEFMDSNCRSLFMGCPIRHLALCHHSSTFFLCS